MPSIESRGFAHPIIMSTTLTDSTTEELADNRLIAVPEAEWERTQDRLDRLEAELNNQATNVSGAFAKVGDIEDRVSDLEADMNDNTRGVEGPKEGTQADTDAPQAAEASKDDPPLMQIVQLPHEMADKQLTANVRRGRFIANDVTDYADRCPAGFVLSSKAIKRVLTAADETNGAPHTQTISRIMDRLSELGGDSVELRKRRGKRIVVFNEQLANRLSDVDHSRCDRKGGPTVPSNVIELS